MKYFHLVKKILKNKRNIFLFPFLLPIVYFFIPEPLFQVDYSTVVLDENNKILRAFLNKKESWYFPPDKNLQIPDKLKLSIIYFEDRYFYYHPGFNPVSIFRAINQNILKNKIISGASTITMQVARLTQPKERSYLNKLKELFLALKIEILYSKEDILKMYLDNAPYGGNIIGYQAASLRYFQKKPEQLTWAEAATLAVLPNAPGLMSPLSNKNRLIQKRNNLLKALFIDNLLDKDMYRLAINEPIPEVISLVNILAPHLSQLLKTRLAKDISIIRTTINKNYQQDLEELVKTHAKYLNLKGIKNVSVLVVDTKSGEVKVYIFWLFHRGFYVKLFLAFASFGARVYLMHLRPGSEHHF